MTTIIETIAFALTTRPCTLRLLSASGSRVFKSQSEHGQNDYYSHSLAGLINRKLSYIMYLKYLAILLAPVSQLVMDPNDEVVETEPCVSF